MDKSLSHFELPESAAKTGSDSDQGSDKSETIELLGYGDIDLSSSASGTTTKSSDEDFFDNNLPETVTLLKYEATGAKVYLVGTVHFSRESQEDVIKVINNVRPNIVVLELCSSRTNILSLDEQSILEEAKNINFQKIVANIRSNGVHNGLMYILLLNMSANLTRQLGMAPGGEFRVAYQEAQKIPNCKIHLGDRPINITLKRALTRLSWFQTFKLAWHLLTSKDTVSVEDIEKCKNRDMLEQLLADLAGEYPQFREVFLDERDIFLTYSLQAAVTKEVDSSSAITEPLKVVGVVGIGHVPGITKLWPVDQKDLARLSLRVPPPSVASKIFRITVRISLVTVGSYFVYRLVVVPIVPKIFKYDYVNGIVQKMMAGVNKMIRTDNVARYSVY